MTSLYSTAALARLKRARADLAARAVVAVHEGADKFAFELTGGILARVAKNDAAARTMTIEENLLAFLAGKTTLRLPEIAFSEDGIDGYPIIPGVALTDDRWRALSERKRDGVAEAIARFAHELHASVSPATAASLGSLPLRWPLSADEIRTALRGRLSREDEAFVETQLTLWSALSPPTDEQRFLHNDLGGHNFAFDESSGNLIGVFDFGDAGVGNLHQEFQYFSSYEGMSEKICARYEKLSRNFLRRDDIALRNAINTFSHVAFAAEDPEARALAEKLGWISGLRESLSAR